MKKLVALLGAALLAVAVSAGAALAAPAAGGSLPQEVEATISVSVDPFGALVLGAGGNWSFQLVGSDLGNGTFRFADSEISGYTITVAGNTAVSVAVDGGTVTWGTTTLTPVYTFTLPDGSAVTFTGGSAATELLATTGPTPPPLPVIELTGFYIDVQDLTQIPAEQSPTGTLTVTVSAGTP